MVSTKDDGDPTTPTGLEQLLWEGHWGRSRRGRGKSATVTS